MRVLCRTHAVSIWMILCLCSGTAAVGLILDRWSVEILRSALPWLCLIYITYRIIVHFAHHKPVAALQQNRTQQLAEVYRATTEALASAIAVKDSYAQDHVNRVCSICNLVARQLMLDENTVDGLRIASAVHDIGNLGVPEYILLKPGPLDSEEFERMQNHAVIGARILGNVDYPWNVTDMVRHHHEKFDGTGYPMHLSGEQIPIGARIISIAEVYDALISERCFREGWGHCEAVEYIQKLSGTHFDPNVVTAFMAVEPEIAKLCVSSLSHTNSEGSAIGRVKVNAATEMIAQANRELVSVFDLAQTLSSTLEIDEVLTLLAHKTKRLVNSATCAVFLMDEAHPQELTARVVVGRYQDIILGSRAKMGKGVTGKAASSLKPYLCNYDPNDLSFNIDGHFSHGLKSCLSAPIISNGKVLGTINLYDCSAHAFSKDDLRMLTFVASRAALAIQNAGDFEAVRESAFRDPITGLYNGRYLNECLEQEFSRSTRRGEPLSVIGIDLDNFKTVNDTYGHPVGDNVLRDVAEIFSRELRDYDVVVRNGGDEFVVVLPTTPPSEASRIADRIQREIACYAQRTMNQGEKKFGASLGIASYPDDASDLETLLRIADAAMYRDKHARKQDQLAA